MQVLGKELGPAYSITDAWTTAGTRNVRAPGARPTCCAGGTGVLVSQESPIVVSLWSYVDQIHCLCALHIYGFNMIPCFNIDTMYSNSLLVFEK